MVPGQRPPSGGVAGDGNESDSERVQTVLEKSMKQIVAGGCAGLVEVCIMHPLDVIKTRFQIQRGPDDPTRYTSMADCVKKMVRNEGPLSFYKGILPPILAETPKRATKSLVTAGLGSGLTEGLVITPFERVKVYMQAQRSRMAVTPSTWFFARQIISSDGLGTRGLLKGLTATLGRHGLFNAVYFGSYYNLKRALLSPESQNSIPFRLLLGFIAGSLASTINIPVDVAKSRIQGPQPADCPNKYHATVATIRIVAKEEGVLALYKGLVPKILRLGPGGAIMLVVYEQVLQFLDTWWK